VQTTKADAFYIISLTKPNGTIRASSPLLAKEGDILTFLGSAGEVGPLEWRWTADRVWEADVPEEALNGVDYAWAYKVKYM
jgi:hypothetical protein